MTALNYQRAKAFTTLPAVDVPFILASASPRRREILAALGFAPRIEPGNIPEPEPGPGETAGAFTVRAARVKARAAAVRHRVGIIIGADTVVIVKGRFMGKPASPQEAGDMLRSLSGRWHEVVTGICLIDIAAGRSRSAWARSRVHFRRLSRQDIEWYVSTGEYRDKAGAYAIQGYASLFIDRIEGCYFNVVGFPVFTFARLCRRLGYCISCPARPTGATFVRKQPGHGL